MPNPWEGGGRVRSPAAVDSVSCRPGTYRNSEESPDCLLCPLGYFCPWGTAVRCPAGTYGAKEGLQREQDCSVCPAGFYCLEGSSRRPGSESLCPRGYYCEAGTSEPHISPCPPGTFGEHFGQTSVAGCKRCAEGRFCPEGAADPGWPCARGRFCPAGTVKEVNCPGGTYTQQQGAASLNECLKCPTGFYCPEGTSDPLPCPRGMFNPLQGQDDATDCRLCYAGKACTQMALPQPDVDCMEGFTCPPGSSRPNALENACPPGTFSNLNNLTDRSQCGLCPPRHACVRGTGGTQRPPVPCFAGVAPLPYIELPNPKRIRSK
ncbi:scavenger receptor class F member 1-like [Polyodon spathula]|uniref:scavenger receptor class F member 1-like n=1 Tax=Polyodon spathula TaxID=7913 RepID=UPI001B7EEED5|nr:scavenger receptor class F member 1-like [Polyodon spathula]